MIALTIDNRNLVDIEVYQTARIDVLKARVKILEAQLRESENQTAIRDEIIHELRCQLG